MKIVAIALFLAGLLLAVRVMLFGVRRQLAEDQFHHRKWPLALAAFLSVAGAMLYARSDDGMTPGWFVAVVLGALLAGTGAWLLVQRSAAIPSTDPEDDPRYRFQGHVARVIQPIIPTGGAASSEGRIAFDFDGKRYEFGARWSPEADVGQQSSTGLNTEVVIEFIDGDVAYVEPWVVVEGRI